MEFIFLLQGKGKENQICISKVHSMLHGGKGSEKNVKQVMIQGVAGGGVGWGEVLAMFYKVVRKAFLKKEIPFLF